MMARVEHDKETCIGCGACVAVAEKFWDMDGAKSHLKGSKKDGKVEVLEVSSEEDVKLNEDAAEVCPVDCIKVVK